MNITGCARYIRIIALRAIKFVELAAAPACGRELIRAITLPRLQRSARFVLSMIIVAGLVVTSEGFAQRAETPPGDSSTPIKQTRAKAKKLKKSKPAIKKAAAKKSRAGKHAAAKAHKRAATGKAMPRKASPKKALLAKRAAKKTAVAKKKTAITQRAGSQRPPATLQKTPVAPQAALATEITSQDSRLRRPVPPQTAPAAATPPRTVTPELKIDKGTLDPASSKGLGPLSEEDNGFSPAWWTAGGAVLAAALGGVVLWKRRRLVDETVPEPPVLEDPILNLDTDFELEPQQVTLPADQLKADLLQRAEPFFTDLRLASTRKDHEFFLQNCTADLATSLILDSETTSPREAPHFDSVKAELVDLFEEVNRYVASVQFTADIQQGDRNPRKLRELWHFIREPDKDAWRLAAVEPT